MQRKKKKKQPHIANTSRSHQDFIVIGDNPMSTLLLDGEASITSEENPTSQILLSKQLQHKILVCPTSRVLQIISIQSVTLALC